MSESYNSSSYVISRRFFAHPALALYAFTFPQRHASTLIQGVENTNDFETLTEIMKLSFTSCAKCQSSPASPTQYQKTRE